MSYASLLKNIPEILSQPTGIAAIASLGIHGAIALIVPLMPVDSSKPKDAASTKAVGLLELTPSDQSRLPQTPSAPQVSFQQQLPLSGQLSPGTSTSQALLPPLPPTSGQTVLPPLPQSYGNYRISSLPPKQSLRINPRGNLGFDNSGFKASGKFSAAVPRLNDSDIKYDESKPLPVNKLPDLQSQGIPDDMQNIQSPTISETTPPTTSAQVNPTPQGVQPGNEVSNNLPQNQVPVAPVGQPPQSTDNLTLAGQSLPQLQPGTIPKIPELPTKISPVAIAQVNSYEDLRKIVQQEYPNAEEKAVIRDTISTDKPNLAGTVLGVLVVDTDGKVLDIKFQDQSVSPEQRLKAREYFLKQAPKGDKKISSYPFSLSFQSGKANTTETTRGQNLPFPANPQPVLPTPGVTNNQPALTPKPLPELQIRNTPPASSPTVTPKPLSEKLRIRSSEPVPSTTVTPQPLTELQIRSNQPTVTPAKPLSTPTVNENQPKFSADSDQKLVQQLRQLREKRQQKSN
ncbi:MAG: hypothetical protein KME21_16735 [Desmonostoc vinosum HA7617-LM4]|jgi:hypothetical protein|nr:hypothetical protein [Desmonostoc vinosum HA7617-LM4]